MGGVGGGGGPDRDQRCIRVCVMVGHVAYSLLRGIVGPAKGATRADRASGGAAL